MKRLLLLLVFLPLFSYGQIKVSEMTSATVVNPTDVFLLIQSGASKKVAFSVFDYSSDEVGAQINDSLIDYRVEVANQIHDSIPTGLSVSFGNDGQVPYMNAGGTDFDYSSSFAWNGTNLNVSKGTFNTFVGTNTGITTTGQDNSFFGNHTGFSNTTGSFNTFLGSNSGYYNTSGGSNTFIGRQAGFSNTTASGNTFIGYLSGNQNTTGKENTHAGYRSGYNNITGNYNTYDGYESGYSNISGSDNSFFGYKSGWSNTTGAFNTFLGDDAGFSNTTGSQNVLIGYQSGLNSIGASGNLMVGFWSGKANTTGASNAFIGSYSGNSNTTGINNTYLGSYSGYNTITGSLNVFLGYQAGQDEAGSNRLYISNSAADTLIYGEFDNDLLHFNADLTVDGDIFADNLIPISATQYQIPYVSSSGNGFDFSSDFTWNDTNLIITNSVGSANIFIGVNAGKLRTTGNSNTIIGEFSGDAMTTASSNTFLGNGAGGLNTNGGSNVLIGADAGKTITSGSQNVMIGQGAGGLATGARNVFIGIASGTNESGSDKLYIENSNSATPLIYGEFDNNYVKINDSLEIAKSLKFSESAKESYSQGKIVYDTTDQALNFYNDIPNFTHSLGYEHVIRFYNNTGGTLTNGTLLRSTGAKINGSVTFTADLAGNASLDSLQGIAMTTVDVPDGEYGIVTLVGQVNGLNTSMFSDNDLLWVGHAGGYVNVSPDPPLWSTIFGRVVYADNDSGAIYMFPVGETRYSPNPTFTARFEDSTEVITNPGLGTYELITSATGTLFGEARNVGFTFQGDSISPLQDGNYTVFLSYSFQGTAAQTDLYRIGIFIDGVKAYSTSRTASGLNNGGVPFPYSAFLTAGQWISFRIANLSDAGRDATFTDGTVTINYSE